MKKKLAGAFLVLCVLLIVAVAFWVSHPFISDSDLHRHDYSEGIENIVKRSHQMTDIEWTPQLDIVSWDGDLVYESGTTYTGIPYGRALYASYVPYDTDLNGFLEAVNDPNSKMYTDRSSFKKDAPYYSCDCSTFVSYTWGLDKIQSTRKIPTFTLMISDSSYDQLQVGDCLCRPNGHVVLITDILYDENEQIRQIEVSECTTKQNNDDCCVRTWYGTGYDLSLDDFQTKFLDSRYAIYRFPGRNQVEYTHCCASPLPGDVCTICGYGLENAG